MSPRQQPVQDAAHVTPRATEPRHGSPWARLRERLAECECPEDALELDPEVARDLHDRIRRANLRH